MRLIITKHILFYPFAALLFLLDIASYSFFERPLLHAILALYCLELMRTNSLPRLLTLFFLLWLELVFEFGITGYELAIIIPVTLIGYFLKNNVYQSRLWPYLLLTGALGTHIIIIEWYANAYCITGSYTIFKILGNIGLMSILSLI